MTTLAPMPDLTLPEAATSLGVLPATLRQQIAKGKLVAVKRGRDWFVTAREVERYRAASRMPKKNEKSANP